MTKAVVLVSGGIDSTVALWWTLREGWKPIPLTFDYFARPAAEKIATKRVLEKAGIRSLTEVPLQFMKEVEDLSKDAGPRRLFKGAPEVYIPARNMVFYSIAAFYAEVFDARYVVGGHNHADPDEFPDSSPAFIKQMNTLMTMGLWSYERRPVEIIAPLGDLTKEGVVRLGLDLGAPLELTWSCHYDKGSPCGRCSSCVEREKAFSSI